jgi:hypothetical protein
MVVLGTGLALKTCPKKPTQKNPLKKNPKKTARKWVFLKGHSALSINLQFFPLKGLKIINKSLMIVFQYKISKINFIKGYHISPKGCNIILLLIFNFG